VGKNVAVFVDVANIFYAAKAAGVDIDYVTLLKSATAGRDFVRAYAYTGLDPDNENQRNFHQFLARHQYKVVSKDIRKYGDGKVKANLDIELVVDLMKTARNLDIAVIVSGDGDFASAIRAVQEMGVRCEVISFRGNTSSDLIEVADLFTDITQIAKVDKSSTRSGRRVADDDEDLSMTEVPEKQSEGTGRGRGRGRGRSTTGRYEREEATATTSRGRGRSSSVPASAPIAAAAAASSGGVLVALPGEKLSRAAAIAPTAEDVEDREDLDETAPEGEEALERVDGEGEGEGEGEGRRRRRRRGGRGRGRARREGGELEDGAAADGEPIQDTDVDGGAEGVEDEAAGPLDREDAAAPTVRSTRADDGRSRSGRTQSGELPTPFDDLDALAAPPRAPRSTPFGSVWDRQLGTPAARPAASSSAPLPDDEDLDEPEVPEYLLAERRRSQGGQGGRGGGQGGRGGRGGRGGAYAAAIERERYGGGRSSAGSGGSRYAEPSRGGGQPGRGGQGPSRPRTDRSDRIDRAPRPSGGEEWSEVPAELEQMLRAQMQRGRPSPEHAAPAPRSGSSAESEGSPSVSEAPAKATPRRRAAKPATAGTAAAGVAPEAPAVSSDEAPAKAAPRRRTARSAPAGVVAEVPVAEAPAKAAPRRRSVKAPAGEAVAEVPVAEAPAKAAPKRRATKAASPETAGTEASAPPAPKRRTTRKAASDAPSEG
jgi:uncharacterized LabA/DUF88 family protein